MVNSGFSYDHYLSVFLSNQFMAEILKKNFKKKYFAPA